MFNAYPPVYATDGRVGDLHYVVLKPESYEVSLLIVKHEHKSEYRLLSVSQVDSVDDDGAIHLSVDHSFVDHSHKFTQEIDVGEQDASLDDQMIWQDIYGVLTEEAPEHIKPMVIESGLDANAILIGKGSRVYTELGEHEGQVEHVVLDKDARKIRYLVIRLHGLRHRSVVASASQVKDWQPNAVVLSLDKEALKALPSHASDH